ncbi:response regulator transcription factor [Flavobacterium caeni]|uniref:DNA-binding response regulator, NarL/FixJ family, contains REC and HTH domains n=1 Tax=Flavobacterium caeni TaxID=490189 RepID=A0A1G5EQT1_9FLAO|nr:response regulator transcription factor [Flavobacterium caeni]SCY29020.1 DNA-binding response regulator, NarL/FixJ family, contains REC and HTH domains [Flavobacterium caeni]
MRIFLADDHPMTIEGYCDALAAATYLERAPLFVKAYDCEQAYQILTTAPGKFDVAILDNSMPPFAEKSILSGVDVAGLIRIYHPDCKIIMITAHTEVIIVYDLVKKVHPDALIIKNDITPEKLRLAVQTVMADGTYQSPLVRACIGEIWKKELMVEDSNRQILFYLSKGFKIKDIEDTIYLTASAIQKRISRMKKAFEVTDDTSLVKEAVRQGFI